MAHTHTQSSPSTIHLHPSGLRCIVFLRSSAMATIFLMHVVWLLFEGGIYSKKHGICSTYISMYGLGLLSDIHNVLLRNVD